MTRLVSITDVVVLVVALVALFLPPRDVKAGPAVGDADARLAIAFVEARVQANPDDAVQVAELSRRFDDAELLDWAVQTAAVGSERARSSATVWRAELATSIAHADRLEVVEALQWVNRSLASCAIAGETACPGWEQVRVDLYQKHLALGVQSGIDPRKEPTKFREAGEKALRSVKAMGAGARPPEPPPPEKTPGTGTGAGSGTGTGTHP